MQPQEESGPGVWRWRLLAAALILGAAALRIAYLAGHCPLDLAPDEAHYWDWSRHLDWSYYSKGPLVAYLIRAGWFLHGSWFHALTINEVLAVRLPAVLCGSLLLVSLYCLMVQVSGNERAGALAVLVALSLPVVGAGSSLMTIDAPYTCCWGWALVLGYQAVFRGAKGAWALAGLVVGLGILAKYTMILFVPSLGLFLLTSPGERRLLAQRGFWIMTGVAAFCCIPILVWNAGHDWVTFRHVQELSGVNDQGLRWWGPLAYVGAQCGLFLGFWFAVWVAAMIACRPWIEPDAGRRYLWWLSAPMFLVFLAFSVKNGGGEPNWPVTAYISGLVLMILWLTRQWQSPDRWYRRALAAGAVGTWVLGCAVSVLMHHTDWMQPILVRVVGTADAAHPMPLRRIDPTCRLRGWRTLAGAVDRVRAELRDEGIEPLVAGSDWSLPGELGFYCAGHPAVSCFGLVAGSRHSQYDLWQPNPLSRPADFRGRTFILVGSLSPALLEAFDRIEPRRTVLYTERGQPIASWALTVCRGYRGFGDPTTLQARQGF